MRRADRAQSELIGNILLVGVVVIVVTTASIGIVLNLTDGGPTSEPTPQADFTVDVTDTEITIGHNGGDSLEASKIRVRVRTASGERKFRMDSPNVTQGNGDTVFEAGEQFQREHNLTGSEFEVRIILEGQQRSRIAQTSIEQPLSPISSGASSASITWASESDWDSAVSSQRVVHEAVGDRSSGTLRLGYRSTDANGQNLTAYWSLDDGEAGQATDASGNSYTGQNNGISSADGVFGTSAYDFDGTGWSEVAGFPDFQRNFSVAGWIRTTDPAVSGQRIFVDDESNTGGYAVSVGDSGNTGAVRFYNRDVNPISMDSPSVVQASTWHHVTATVNTRTQTRTIYRNGTQIQQGTYSGSWGTDSGPAAIGGETAQGETGNRFDGRIDELRIYNRTLTDADTQRLYETSQNGTFVTGTKQFDTPVSASELTLSNLSVNRPSATGVNVTVLSDPDDDGTFEGSSDTITLDSSTSYDVTGLNSNSKTYRLRVGLSTTSATTSPVVDGVSLERP